MKITIDTVNKTIEVNDGATLDEVMDFVNKLNIDIKEYRLVQKSETVFIPYHITQPKINPITPYWKPTDEFYFDHLYRPGQITYSTSSETFKIN